MGDDIGALFRQLTLGVYVVGVAHGERRSAFTAAWITQVSFDPLFLALSINPGNASYSLLRESGAFAVTVLEASQSDVARHFGTPSPEHRDKLAGVRWRPGRSGAPILQDGLAYFDCAVRGSMRAGDHEVMLGQVVDGQILKPGASPLVYRDTGDMDGSSALYPAAF